MTSAAGVCAFAVTWWVCIKHLHQTEEAAFALAGGALTLAMAPLVWWAGRERTRAQQPSNPDLIMETGRQRIKTAVASAIGGPGTVINIHPQDTSERPTESTAGASRPPAEQVVVGQIPRKFPNLQPRLSILRELTYSARRGRVIAVTGPRGVGKTQVAAAYARQRIDEQFPIVAWINAESSELMLAGLNALAIALKLWAADEDSATGLARLRAHLEGRLEPALLVFDNVTDPDSITDYLPSRGVTEVVITSTFRAVEKLGRRVEVDVFEPLEAQRFLRAATGIDDAAGAAQVADELGYLPLALDQAASLINGERLDYSIYLHRLHRRPVTQYLQRRPADPYPRGAAEAILLSLNGAGFDHDPATRVLLEILCLLSPDGVPRTLLYTGDDVLTDARLRDLVDASIINFTVDGSSIIIHRLVQRVIRDRLECSGDLSNAVLTTVDQLSVALFEEQDAWRRRLEGDRFSQQIHILWGHAETILSDAALLERVFVLLNWSVRQLIGSSDLTRSIPAAAGVLHDSRRVLGLDHPDTLTSANNLAYAYESAGWLADAIPLYEQTLTDRQRVRGPDHPDTLKSANNLAYAYRTAGRLSEAIALHERNLGDCRRVLGLDHPDTLASTNNLAHAYESAGRLDEALALYEQTLTDRCRVLGLDHPDTLTSANHLASAYRVADRLDEAIVLHEQTLADCRRVLGPDHPYTLESASKLAYAYGAAGRVGEAIPLYERTLADCRRVLGLDHTNTLTAANHLASAYQVAGQLGEAIVLHEQTLVDCRRVLGPDHPNTLRSANNLASAYRAVGRVTKAIALHEQTLADYRRVLGPDHPYTLDSANNLAGAYRAAGRLTKAIALHEQTLADRRRVLGPYHAGTFASAKYLAGAYESAGRLVEAIALYEQTVADRGRVLGPDHPDTLDSANHLAYAYESAGRSDEAIALYEQTYNDCRRVLGPDHPDTVTSAKNLAYAYRATGGDVRRLTWRRWLRRR